MANIKSAQKQNRQRITREARNKARKTEMRTAIKKARLAISEKDGADAKDLVTQAIKLVDRAANKSLIKPAAASRTVSRLTRAAQKA